MNAAAGPRFAWACVHANRFVAMLEEIGYERIETFGDYAESPASVGDSVHVFVAFKGK